MLNLTTNDGQYLGVHVDTDDKSLLELHIDDGDGSQTKVRLNSLDILGIQETFTKWTILNGGC